MYTMLEQIAEEGRKAESAIVSFVGKHGRIRRWNYPSADFFVMSVNGDYAWEELSEEGLLVQTKVYQEYRVWHEKAALVASTLTPDSKLEFDKDAKKISTIIQMNEHLGSSSVDSVISDIRSLFSKLLAILNRSVDHSPDRTIYAPDTNALILNPAVDQWRFGGERFELVLLPTVLAELDKLKVSGRHEDLRKKVSSVIRRLKGYRGRGSVLEGVTLASGMSTMRWIATEPRFDQTLSWLMSDNNDDRIIACVLEIMVKCPRSRVALVTADINLQNKAELAGVPFVEPPEPSED